MSCLVLFRRHVFVLGFVRFETVPLDVIQVVMLMSGDDDDPTASSPHQPPLKTVAVMSETVETVDLISETVKVVAVSEEDVLSSPSVLWATFDSSVLSDKTRQKTTRDQNQDNQ